MIPLKNGSMAAMALSLLTLAEPSLCHADDPIPPACFKQIDEDVTASFRFHESPHKDELNKILQNSVNYSSDPKALPQNLGLKPSTENIPAGTKEYFVVSSQLTKKAHRQCLTKTRPDITEEQLSKEMTSLEDRFEVGVVFRVFMNINDHSNCQVKRLDHECFSIDKRENSPHEPIFSNRTSLGSEQYCQTGISNSNLTQGEILTRCQNHYGSLFDLYQKDKNTGDLSELPSAQSCKKFFSYVDFSKKPNGTNILKSPCTGPLPERAAKTSTSGSTINNNKAKPATK